MSTLASASEKTDGPRCRVCNTVATAAFKANDYITHDVFSVYVCPQCETGFTWPCPENLDPYYPKYYRRYNPLTERIMKVLFNLRVRNWMRRFAKPGRALEVGVGNGWMLKSLASHGWEVLGLERTEEGARHAAEATGLPVRAGDLKDIVDEKKFDLIIMYNVLEHVWDPREILRKCSALLSSSGKMIVVVPNFSSWQAKLTRAHWFHLDVPRHLIHFSVDGLYKAFALESFKVDSRRFVSWEHDPYGWVQSLLNCFGFKQNRLTRGLMGAGKQELLSPAGIGMFITAALLTPFMVLAALASWTLGAGALVEVWAGKQPQVQ